ncbi:outer membrane beta-barrel protein [Reichenbachiella sp.]|uniref:outer membrane beta-barrel protein n=1 Tax=Reichenbachiella sp. TaxID=2184521 RepID=UPI003B58DB97
MKNVKPYLLILFILIWASDLQAQKALGIAIGSVTNKFEGDRVSKFFDVGFRMHSSLLVGLVLDVPIKEDVYITFSPGYKEISGTIYEENEEYIDQIEQGIEEPNVPRFIDVSFLEIDNLSLPILLKIISDNKRWQFMAGIETLWNFRSELTILDTGEQINVRSFMKSVNYTAIFGLGYRFKIKKARFAFDLMYTQGLNNMSSGRELPNGSVPRIKSTTGETRLTWFFLNKTDNSK